MRALPVAFLGACLVACVPAGGEGPGPAASGESWRLYQGLYRGRRIDVHTPEGLPEKAAARLVRALAERREFGLRLNPEQDDPGAVRILCGSPADPELALLVRACGVEGLGDGFRVLGREFLSGGDALQAVLEDPERPGLPLCLVLCNDPARLHAYLDEIPRLTRPELTVWGEGELVLRCPLASDGAPRADELRDYRQQREEYFAAAPAREVEGLVVHARSEPEREQWRAYGMALAGARKRVLSWLGGSAELRAEVFLYEHLEDFERCLGESVLSVANRLHPRVHVLLAPGLPDDGGAALARVLARAIAGQPFAPWMWDGIALAACGRYWQRPLEEWIARLALGKLLPDVRDVTAADGLERWSEHALRPARGFLFRHMMQGLQGDPRRVRALWKGAQSSPKKVLALYRGSVLKAVKGSKQARSARLAGTAAHGDRLARAPFRRGIALVEGAQGGYSSRALGEAIGALRALGSGPDAVSLTVLASGEDPLPPLCALEGRAVHGSASDAALASACAAARAAEMRVLLSLEALARPTGSWADGISWTGAGDQQAFWRDYGKVALHYALLAELLRLELFSLGSNLRDVSRTEPKGDVFDPRTIAARRNGWSGLIARVRAAYGGGLTYTARFPAEAQEVGFFDQLDFIGLALYQRLAGPERGPEEAELRRNLRFQIEQAIELSVRWNKPLLLVQLGFPAREDSWSKPAVPRGAFDPAAQERYLAALADVLGGKLENGEALRGFFLWNWPVDPRSAGAGDGDFSLRRPPVESALARLFAR